MGQRGVPVRERRGSQDGIILTGEDCRGQVAQLVGRNPFRGLIQDVALAACELIQERRLADAAATVEDAELGTSAAPAARQPIHLEFTVDEQTRPCDVR